MPPDELLWRRFLRDTQKMKSAKGLRVVHDEEANLQSKTSLEEGSCQSGRNLQQLNKDDYLETSLTFIGSSLTAEKDNAM